jgi:hypothetical protein
MAISLIGLSSIELLIRIDNKDGIGVVVGLPLTVTSVHIGFYSHVIKQHEYYKQKKSQ